MKNTLSGFSYILLTFFCVTVGNKAWGQQYNSDNYLSKPLGVSTIILSAGQRNNIIMTTFSLLPKWEFTAYVYVYNDDKNNRTNDGYTSSFYFKYMFYENQAKTGGFAMKGGTGLSPGLLNDSDRIKDEFKTYWMNAPVTIPFNNNKLSLDIMPGASYSIRNSQKQDPTWAFTYSTRLAWYPLNPTLALVGEVYGSKNKAKSSPEYKVGLRWEPNEHAVFALTYSEKFDHTRGAGFEFGIMLFTPPFCGLVKERKK